MRRAVRSHPPAIAWMTLIACAALAGCGEPESGRQYPAAGPSATEPPSPPPPRDGFAVPDARTRVRAAGALAGLADGVRDAFAPGPGFIPIVPPGPGDWLAQHSEPGQTFDHYVASRPNRPGRGGRRAIYILPIGELGPAAPPLDLLAAFTRAHFQLPVRVLPPISVADTRARTRMQGERRQLLAPDLLEHLRTILPADAYALVGLTAVDLYPGPDWNFVFGMASFRERVGVYSIARYHPSFAGGGGKSPAAPWVLSRTLKVMAHEIGHMFGMEHCIYYECVMNGSNHLAETDRRPMNLCPVCLRKLHHAVGFSPRERYRDLGRFFRAFRLDSEAAWARARAAELSPPDPASPPPP